MPPADTLTGHTQTLCCSASHLYRSPWKTFGAELNLLIVDNPGQLSLEQRATCRATFRWSEATVSIYTFNYYAALQHQYCSISPEKRGNCQRIIPEQLPHWPVSIPWTLSPGANAPGLITAAPSHVETNIWMHSNDCHVTVLHNVCLPELGKTPSPSLLPSPHCSWSLDPNIVAPLP